MVKLERGYRLRERFLAVDLHREVVGHRLAEALMRDDQAAYRHWHEVYSFAVRPAATDDPIVAFRWLATHPDLPIRGD